MNCMCVLPYLGEYEHLSSQMAELDAMCSFVLGVVSNIDIHMSGFSFSSASN